MVSALVNAHRCAALAYARAAGIAVRLARTGIAAGPLGDPGVATLIAGLQDVHW